MSHHTNSLLQFVCIIAMGVAVMGLGQKTYASGATDEASTRDAQIEALIAQLGALKTEVAELRTAGNESWLAQRRKAEIKQLIQDVLVDAESRATFMNEGSNALTAGHDDKAFFLKSPDDKFLMYINGLLQFRWIGNFRGDESGRPSVSPTDDNETGFEFRRIELGLSGHIGDPRIGYVLVLATEDGAAGVEQIIAQDVILSYAVTDHLTLAGGRYFAPFLREELMGGGGSLAVALSYMNNTLSVGRAEGLSAIYERESYRARLFFNDGAGSGGGGGVNNPFADAVDWAATVRGDVKLAGEWGQWGDFSAWQGEPLAAFIGGAVHYQQGETGDSVPANDVDLFNWTVDASIENNGFNVYVAVAGTHANSGTAPDIDNYGVVAQAGYMVVPDKFEPFLRYEYLMFDEDLGFVDNHVGLVTVGANYHLNKRAKFALDVIWALDPIPTDSLNAGLLADGAEDNQVVVRGQLQLKF